MRVELTLGVLPAEVDRPVVLDRSGDKHTISGDDRAARSTELTDQAPRVVDVVLQALRTEELDPVELKEQHQIQHAEHDAETPDPEVHAVPFAGRIKTRCSCDMRTSSASRT